MEINSTLAPLIPDLLDGLPEAAVVEFLAAGGIQNLDQAADLVGAVAGRVNKTRIFKERCGLPEKLSNHGN